ncbi:hypothetical protein [Natronococcus pandeyae]|uniref:hypothetical protein n=1 Tax=Natronococcus pandeyae TaxID=2055836 RepID=UPI0011E63304|nr:hypothetical protein [Natronococcus pandeyae]
MTEDEIRDLPKYQEAIKQANSLDQLIQIFPLLELMGADTSELSAIYEDEELEDIIDDIEKTIEVPDRFVDALGEKGWVIHERLNLDIASEAAKKAENGDVDEAEELLVSYFDRKTIDINLVQMKSISAFKPRYMLARKAAEDYEEGRFHACVPVVLMLIDGLVQQVHIDVFGEAQNASAENTKLEAWNSVAGHSKSLNQFLDIFGKQRIKTRTGRIEKPYRHGILHGTDLGYDNELVAAKSWNALFAVGEWAKKAEQNELAPPSEDKELSPIESLSQSIEKEKRLQERKQAFEESEGRDINVGRDIPPNGNPEDYQSETPEKAFTEFLSFWQDKNYGKMCAYVSGPAGKDINPGEIRERFNDYELVTWNLIEVDHSTGAVADIVVRLQLDWKNKSQERTKEIKLAYQNDKEKLVPPELEDGDWMILNHFELRSP